MIGAIVLAAGASTRYGTSKQLVSLDGRPLLWHAVQAARTHEEISRVIVVLGAHHKAVRAGVPLGGVQTVRCAEWSRGTGATLRCGLRALGPVSAAVVLLGDQPGVRAAAISRVLERGAVARAVYGGEIGHPLVLPGDVAARLAAAPAVGGPGREALTGLEVELVDCTDLGGGADVDVPADLARAARS